MKKKLGIGAIFVTIDGVGFILGTLLEFSDLGRPWSFFEGSFSVWFCRYPGC